MQAQWSVRNSIYQWSETDLEKIFMPYAVLDTTQVLQNRDLG